MASTTDFGSVSSGSSPDTSTTSPGVYSEAGPSTECASGSYIRNCNKWLLSSAG
jgi:hypothetical protein